MRGMLFPASQIFSDYDVLTHRSDQVNVVFGCTHLSNFRCFQATGLGALSPGRVGLATTPWGRVEQGLSLKG